MFINEQGGLHLSIDLARFFLFFFLSFLGNKATFVTEQ